MTESIVFDGLTREEKSLAVFAQGVLNRKGKRIFIDCDNYKTYLSDEYTEVGLWALIKKYAGEFSGAVIYDLDENDVSVNMAATMCATGDHLGVPRALINKINALGIKTVSDLAGIKGTRAERQRVVFEKCKDKLNRSAVVHQVVKPGNFHLTLRDGAISDRLFCFYTSETAEDRAFRNEVLDWLDKCSPVYGWNDDEIAFIKDISDHGDYMVPSDWSSDHSYFKSENLSVKQNVKRTAIAPSKHYVAFVVSDGDNVQWLERDFATTHIFGQRKLSPLDYKINWTVSPSLIDICPQAAQSIYKTKKHDYFISGVSGAGYCNPMTFPRKYLDAFTGKTERLMRRSDMSVVCMLDNIKNTENTDQTRDRLYSYAKYASIKGGIWELDPDRYCSGKGRIFWSNDKPFVSVRFTLWHPSGRPENVDEKWLDEMVCEINKMSPSPSSEDGYSVINVHPWTISMENLDYVAARLKSHIEIVYADELIDMVAKNVKSER